MTNIEEKLQTLELTIADATARIELIRKELSESEKEKDSSLDYLTVDLDKVHSWEAVAKAFNIDPVNSLPRPQPKDADEENDNAYFQAKKVVKLFNKDNKFPDYDNGNQTKHNPVFDLRNLGVGFSHSHCAHWRSGSDVGARLSWKEFETMKEVVTKRFPQIWEKLMR